MKNYFAIMPLLFITAGCAVMDRAPECDPLEASDTLSQLNAVSKNTAVCLNQDLLESDANYMIDLLQQLQKDPSFTNNKQDFENLERVVQTMKWYSKTGRMSVNSCKYYYKSIEKKTYNIAHGIK